ncbi:MAG: tyrosine--tRNA ligase, partial [Proteobacteria bacterium]|nr:tyrosine--tRNA ligase [Pseudomonadota bacterium]
MSKLDILKDRGAIYQISDYKLVEDLLEHPKGKSFYIGFDPTADSLHLGSMYALMTVSRFASAGLRPIIVLGGGTGMVGDPSGKTEMRNLLTEESAKKNLKAIEHQIRNIIPKDPEPLFVNNADWLKDLNLIEFLRDVGRHFSINRMLTQDCVKSRLEKGITYLEFSYMLLQAYDFVYLNKHEHCMLQIGGADQWGNMVMGMDLARRINTSDVQCMTFELMMTAIGDKMGKTAKGAIWLDREKTSPYEYYQYWINVDDRDVKKFFLCYTYLEIKEIEDIFKEITDIRTLKSVLAFEATRILHGEAEALKAQASSKALFCGDGSELEGVPVFNIDSKKLSDGISAVDLITISGLVTSKSEARRLIQGGGAYVNDEK